MKGIQFLNDGPLLSPRGDTYEIVKIQKEKSSAAETVAVTWLNYCRYDVKIYSINYLITGPISIKLGSNRLLVMGI